MDFHSLACYTYLRSMGYFWKTNQRLLPMVRTSSWLFVSFFSLSHLLSGQVLSDSAYIRQHYRKMEYLIPMRDGVKLHTTVYSPKNGERAYPILMKRTPYSSLPYGKDAYPTSLGPSRHLMRDLYIFVYQDVRGRWMSEGDYDNMRPHIKGNNPNNIKAIDESSDTFDTIEWLLKNVANNNGKVGQWGISYPGFYTAAALPEAHPALVASSPQAPIADFYFDDFHHMGAFLQSYIGAVPIFGYQTDGPVDTAWYRSAWRRLNARGDTRDGYQFYLDLGPLKNISDIYPDDFFWKQLTEHPNYDDFWQQRSIIPHLRGVNHAVLTVGGWFDAEDLYGPLSIYKTLEDKNPNIKANHLIMGPWSHGDWARERGYQAVNHIYYGDSVSTFYQTKIEKPFFDYHLKDTGNLSLPAAFLFDTGTKEWKTFGSWPPADLSPIRLRFAENGTLRINEPVNEEATFSYMSDPAHPVPHRSEVAPVGITPRAFMTDDQRHAARRPDVLTFQTPPLTEPLTFAGEILAKLRVSLDIEDADFVVKIIDVYPSDAPPTKATPDHVLMSGYQQLVRSEVFRGRFRNGFANSEPFELGEVTAVEFPLQDMLHTFLPGHRVMIQIHSTWFPYIDRNPQKYVENIFKAEKEDFIKGNITIHGSSEVTIGEPQELGFDWKR